LQKKCDMLCIFLAFFFGLADQLGQLTVTVAHHSSFIYSHAPHLWIRPSEVHFSRVRVGTANGGDSTGCALSIEN